MGACPAGKPREIVPVADPGRAVALTRSVSEQMPSHAVPDFIRDVLAERFRQMSAKPARLVDVAFRCRFQALASQSEPFPHPFRIILARIRVPPIGGAAVLGVVLDRPPQPERRLPHRIQAGACSRSGNAGPVTATTSSSPAQPWPSTWPPRADRSSATARTTHCRTSSHLTATASVGSSAISTGNGTSDCGPQSSTSSHGSKTGKSFANAVAKAILWTNCSRSSPDCTTSDSNYGSTTSCDESYDRWSSNRLTTGRRELVT